MKFFLLITGMFLACFVATAQDKESLIGKWKLVSFRTSEMYYDVVKDSLHVDELEDEPALNIETDSTIKKLQAEMKEMCANAFFEFKAGMAYTKGFGMPLETTTGRYSVDESLKTVTFTSVKPTGELKQEEPVKYSFNKTGLVFKIDDADGGFIIEFAKQ